MIKKFNNLSLIIGIPGIVIQAYGAIVKLPELQIAGSIILLVAFYYYAVSKGRHPAFCLLGLLSIFGLLILGALKDKSSSEEVAPEKGNSKGFLIFIAVLVFLVFAIPFVNSLLNH